jgi:tetratricopeptide (TPR) repeat protein
MAHTEPATLERATTLLRNAQPLAAAAVCGAILAQEPANAVAAQLLGLALKDTGDLVEGERWLRFSIQLEPNLGEFHANLGNLLRKGEKYAEAEAAYRRALELLPNHRPAGRGLALTLIDLKRPSEAEAHCRALLAADPADSEVWDILGLALASLGRLEESESAHRRAVAIDPQNKVAHHNLGALLVQMERPEAIEALENARKLGADGYEAAFNRGRAALNAGELDEAERSFERAAQLRPLDVEAQSTLAHVRYMRGDPAFVRTLVSAVKANRESAKLQLLLGEILWRAGQLREAETLARDLLMRGNRAAAARSTLAGILFDQGRADEAETHALEAAAMRPQEQAVLLNVVTILLARGRVEEAVPFIDAQLSRHPDSQMWLAYQATASRMLGTNRYHELYDYDRFVRVFDLEPPPGWSSMAQFNRDLAAALHGRHQFTRQPLDQTLRNGTQTSRSLLNDPDPVVRAALRAFERPIEEYRRTLDASDDHPLSRGNVGASQFTGAWSVRLHRNGFHVNHFHPDGMLSSAYYVEVPPETEDQALKSGWIKFGEPRYPVPGLTPERYVQPKPGRLVLFPSYMWHGTNPIYGEEPRLCIAFDMRPKSG